METTVTYRCTAPSHQSADGGPDKLTVHDGKWAFCPYDAKAEGHEWAPSGGLSLSLLRHAAAQRQREPSGKERAEAR